MLKKYHFIIVSQNIFLADVSFSFHDTFSLARGYLSLSLNVKAAKNKQSFKKFGCYLALNKLRD